MAGPTDAEWQQCHKHFHCRHEPIERTENRVHIICDSWWVSSLSSKASSKRWIAAMSSVPSLIQQTHTMSKTFVVIVNSISSRKTVSKLAGNKKIVAFAEPLSQTTLCLHFLTLLQSSPSAEQIQRMNIVWDVWRLRNHSYGSESRSGWKMLETAERDTINAFHLNCQWKSLLIQWHWMKWIEMNWNESEINEWNLRLEL